jgi:hypothetical protein
MKRLLRRWLQRILYDDSESNKVSRPAGKVRQSSEAPQRMNFTVYPADGGQVVEIETYDKRTNNFNLAVYIIKEEDDFAARIARIMTIEGLKQ